MSVRLCLCIAATALGTLLPPLSAPAEAQRYTPRVYNGARFHNTRNATMRAMLARKKAAAARRAAAQRKAARR